VQQGSEISSPRTPGSPKNYFTSDTIIQETGRSPRMAGNGKNLKNGKNINGHGSNKSPSRFDTSGFAHGGRSVSAMGGRLTGSQKGSILHEEGKNRPRTDGSPLLAGSPGKNLGKRDYVYDGQMPNLDGGQSPSHADVAASNNRALKNFAGHMIGIEHAGSTTGTGTGSKGTGTRTTSSKFGTTTGSSFWSGGAGVVSAAPASPNINKPVVEPTPSQWKIAFDKMRVELILAMRLYQSQKTKLDYAEKQKQLYMARSRQLKTDLQKAWRQLTDPQAIATKVFQEKLDMTKVVQVF
jgi:hypothetical protein